MCYYFFENVDVWTCLSFTMRVLSLHECVFIFETSQLVWLSKLDDESWSLYEYVFIFEASKVFIFSLHSSYRSLQMIWVQCSFLKKKTFLFDNNVIPQYWFEIDESIEITFFNVTFFARNHKTRKLIRDFEPNKKEY